MSIEFTFAAICIFFSPVSSSRTQILAPLSWPPFWINFHSPWTNRSRDFCCVPGSSLLQPPYWKTRRPWAPGCGITFAAGARSLNRFQIIIIGHEDPFSYLILSGGKIENCEQSIQLSPFPFFIKWLKIINMFIAPAGISPRGRNPEEAL